MSSNKKKMQRKIEIQEKEYIKLRKKEALQFMVALASAVSFCQVLTTYRHTDSYWVFTISTNRAKHF